MKALGLIAMILAIICFVIPIIGPYLTVVSAILAAFSAGPGITFGAVAIGLNLINVIFLSPALWLVEAGARSVEGASTGPGVFVVLSQIIAAVVLMVVHAKMKKKGVQETAED